MMAGNVRRPSYSFSSFPLSLPRGINNKFPLQPHQKYYISQYEEVAFHSLLRWEMSATINSHFLSHIFLFERLGEFTF